jgi:hypothetical protein
MLLARIAPPRFDATMWVSDVRTRHSSAKARCRLVAPTAFGDGVANIDDVADLAIVGHHHRPLEAGDLAGPETGLDRQQRDHSVALRLPSLAGIDEHAPQCGWRYDLGLFS